MIVLIAILLIPIILACLRIFTAAPSVGRKRADSWRSTPFAHRGFFGDGLTENSLGAFERACRCGYGIELDVQLTADDVAVIFHDDDLKRLMGDSRRVDALTFDELRRIPLPDGTPVPSFEEVLRCVNGRVPLLVELKNVKKNDLLCRIVLDMLRAYDGPFVVESFNPLNVRWFKKHAPDIIRGQLVTFYEDYLPEFSEGFAKRMAALSLNFLSRPDFVAYNVSADMPALRLQRRLFKTPLACWTVRSQELFDELIARGEMPIFEGFDPLNALEKNS